MPAREQSVMLTRKTYAVKRNQITAHDQPKLTYGLSQSKDGFGGAVGVAMVGGVPVSNVQSRPSCCCYSKIAAYSATGPQHVLQYQSRHHLCGFTGPIYTSIITISLCQPVLQVN